MTLKTDANNVTPIKMAKVQSKDYSILMILTAILTEEADGGFVAYNPETGAASQGDHLGEAIANLKEATSLYLEVFPLEEKVTKQPFLTTFEVACA